MITSSASSPPPPPPGADMNILVTGGSGYIAEFILQDLLLAFPQATFFTTFCHHALEMPQGIVAMEMDLTREDSIRTCVENADPHVIVHCAALSSLKACENNPELAQKINVTGSQLLFELATARRCKHFVFLSTDQVYSGRGGASEDAYVEGDRAEPINVYGKTKREFESFLEQQHECCWTILRLSNVFGPRTLPLTHRVEQDKFLQFLFKRLSNEEQETELVVWENETRSFVSVLDVAQAVSGVVRKKAMGTFNCGGPNALTRVEFAQLARECISMSTCVIVPEKNVCETSPHDLSMDSTRLENLVLGRAMQRVTSQALAIGL